MLEPHLKFETQLKFFKFCLGLPELNPVQTLVGLPSVYSLCVPDDCCPDEPTQWFSSQ